MSDPHGYGGSYQGDVEDARAAAEARAKHVAGLEARIAAWEPAIKALRVCDDHMWTVDAMKRLRRVYNAIPYEHKPLEFSE